jgi:hypothetical protein
MLYRGDVLGDRARLSIARAQLAEAKAARIPFATFVDVGYTQMSSIRRTGQSEEWFARVGVSLPIWDWFGINKKHEVPAAAVRSLESQLAMQRAFISAEIAQAVKRLASADAQLSRTDKDLADLHADLKKSLADTQLAAADVSDMAKGRRIEHDFTDLARQMEVTRHGALADYQAALMALEKAIGVRVERALSSSSAAVTPLPVSANRQP